MLPDSDAIGAMILIDGMARRLLFEAVTHIHTDQPQHANTDGNDREPASVDSGRRKWFGGFVQDGAIGQDSRFGELVERINADLDHEQQEENRGYLEKSLHVDQVAESRPTP